MPIHDGVENQKQRGISLLLVAAALVVLAGMAALAIDLSMLYVGRGEAQRAADAAALAGAKKFVESGYISGFIPQSAAEDQARLEAITVAAQNNVNNQAAQVLPEDVTFGCGMVNPTGGNPPCINPTITVAVQRTVARANPVPTVFARLLGIAQAEVSAVATAEVYRPQPGQVPLVGTRCMKPWILPNCDPLHTTPTNPNCDVAYYVDPTTGDVVYPQPVGQGGVIGASFILKAGNPSQSPAPGQFYPIFVPPGSESAICPECAGSGGGGPGAATYRQNIACCNTNEWVCGEQVAVDEQTGDMVGPTNQGVTCLINQLNPNCPGNPANCGQDFLTAPNTNPFLITGGTNNPNPDLRGQTISTSPSLVTVPLYAGYPLAPGESGPIPAVTIIGFMQLFLEKVGPPQSTVTAHILNISGCGASTGGGAPGGGGSDGGGGGGESGSPLGGTGQILTGPGGSPYPVRLIRPGSGS